MSILIAGYPYVRENFFNTLRHYPKKGALLFFLPKVWKVKGGKVTYRPPTDPNVFTVEAYFHHSNYPLVGGLLKGWMPGFLPFVVSNRRTKNIKAVLTLTEPILLTTLYQGFISKFLGLKHFFYTWENIPYDRKFKGLNLCLKKLILQLNLHFSDGIICGNKKAAEILKKYTDRPLAVFPYAGIDADFFTPQRGDRVFLGKDFLNKIVFSFIGALDSRKGVDLILKSFSAVLNKIPGAFLVIAGSGDKKYEELLGRLTREYGLEERILMVPWLEHHQVKKLLSVTDVFLYPSLPTGGWEEQFGYSMLEASSAGVPVISTRTGSIDEVVIDGKTGLLVEPNDFNQLTDAMIKLGQDEELRTTLGSQGREYVVNNFSMNKIAGKFYDFFNKFQ